MDAKKNTKEIPGMVPPQAVDFEEAVLGGIMIDKHALSSIADMIKPDVFYKSAHQKLMEAILRLNKKNEPVDILTVTQELKVTNDLEEVGGPFYVTSLTSRIASTANIEYHASIIYQKYILRKLIEISHNVTRKAYEEEDCFDLIQDTQEQLSTLSGFDRGNVQHLSGILTELLQQIDRNIKNEGTLTGVPTGFKYFDKHSNGLQKGDLIIVAGETSNGKTALALNIGSHAASQGETVAIYSYEMSDRQLASRLLASESSVSSKDILYSRLNDEQLNNVHTGVGNLYEQRIFIDDLESSKYDYLERSIRSMVIRERASLVIIDYLQLIKLPSKNLQKTDQVAQIANDLKNLAKTLNIPIILISQLSRDKNNPVPSLARLKGSGDIENAADIIWLLWQPSIYNRDTFECMNQVFVSEGNSQHFIAKGRNIGTTEFTLGFVKHLTKFQNELNESETQRF